MFLFISQIWYSLTSVPGIICIYLFRMFPTTLSKCKEGEVNSGRDIKKSTGWTVTKEQDDVWWRMKEESTLIWGTAKLWTAIRARLISSELKGICRQQEEGERKERQENGFLFFTVERRKMDSQYARICKGWARWRRKREWKIHI